MKLATTMRDQSAEFAAALRDVNAQLDAALVRAVAAEQRAERAAAALRRTCTLHPRENAHEDNGPVVWWMLPISEPPYVGTELDTDFPDNMTHWHHLPTVLFLDDEEVAACRR